MTKIIFNFCLLSLVLLSACSKDNSISLEENSPLSSQNQPSIQALATTLTPYYWSNLLVTNINPVDNFYVNSTGSVSWVGQNGATIYACSTDCSGYLNRLLTQTYGYTSTYYQTWMGVTRPLAKHYYSEIVANDHFTQILAATQIQQGDIVAIKYPADATNTGHCMLVAASPTLRTASAPLVAGTTQYELSIMDSSSSGHGITDTRYPTADTGVGKGIFRLYVATDGSIAGYSWSTSSGSVYYPQSERPLAVGRLIP